MVKINSLFIGHLPREVLEDYVRLLGLSGTDDRRDFTKYDLMQVQAVEAYCQSGMEARLRETYMGCKADIYARGSTMTPYKLLTVLRQMLRLFELTLTVRERSIANLKVVVYRIVRTVDACRGGPHVEIREARQVVRFD